MLCILVASALAGNYNIETSYTRVVGRNARPVLVYRCASTIDYSKFKVNSDRPLRELNLIAKDGDDGIRIKQRDNRTTRTNGHSANTSYHFEPIPIEQITP